MKPPDRKRLPSSPEEWAEEYILKKVQKSYKYSIRCALCTVPFAFKYYGSFNHHSNV